ncbi:hypothetical protein [Crenobacter cavernae]|uniref:Uncharacterized protein n=1 Tax=Crenobacter cavernae TaxID=2290923 RepID=A0A345Y2R2_9NEIS|nr:hypothetical protein [Crenobacter cavernae]AXK38214.1 hypothetical protein DWG20_01505 [Crenobacter cavernae]
MDLTEASLEQIYDELDRRERTPPRTRYKWQCRQCGHEFVGGTGMKGVAIMAGEVYCACCAVFPRDAETPGLLVPMKKQPYSAA